jgi:DNA-binding NtrC family response regulator
MSNILSVDTIGITDQCDEHAEQASGNPATVSTASGLNYVTTGEDLTLRGILDAAESEAILRALQHTGWNRKRAAALLKISYRGLLYKIRNHSLTPPLAGD